MGSLIRKKWMFVLFLVILLLNFNVCNAYVSYIPHILKESGNVNIGRKIFLNSFRCPLGARCWFFLTNNTYEIIIDKKYSSTSPKIFHVDGATHTCEIKQDKKTIYKCTFNFVSSSYYFEKEKYFKLKVYSISLAFPVACLFLRRFLTKKQFLILFLASIAIVVILFVSWLYQYAFTLTPLC